MSAADFSPASWRKSSRSGNSGNCVEVAFAPVMWRKSSRSSNTTNCVEVALCEHAVGVRDSKQATGPHLVFTEAVWAGFLGRMQ